MRRIIERYEKLLYSFLLLIHLVPLISVRYFVTLDGPSHLNNSVLISRLLTFEKTAEAFFEINPQPEPNWTGHALMAVGNIFFTAHKSEKLLQVICIILFLVFFRKLVLTINKDAAWASYLAFPFAYSLPFHLGFYNFCIGLALLFFSMNYYLSIKDKPTLRNTLFLFALLVFLYFSHLFIIGIFFVFVLIMNVDLHKFVRFDWTDQKLHGNIYLAFLPFLVLTVNFFLKKKIISENFVYDIPYYDLTEWIWLCRPLITLAFDEEKSFSAVMAGATGVLLVGMFYNTFFSKKSSFNKWSVLSLFTLIAYYVLPDSLASGSFVSVRMLLMFFLFLFLWFSTGYFPKYIKISAVTVSLAVSFYFLLYHFTHAKNLNYNAAELFSVAEQIEQGSVVLPLNYSDNWLHSNLPAYIGTVKNFIVLDNYEAAKPQFPVMWKENVNPYKLLGNFSGRKPPCADVTLYEQATGKKIDYIVTWNYSPSTDSCQTGIDSLIAENFERCFTSEKGNAILYKRQQ